MHISYKITNLCLIKSRQFLSLKLQHTQKVYHSFQKYPAIFKMPRNKDEIAALKEIRMKKRKQCKSARFPPGEIYLCVLGNGSISSPKALYMFTDHERYLFNCGEGTQRLSSEHKTKLSKLDNIFITHKSWDNIGGLLGLSLTLQDMGVPEITLHGPPEIDSLFDQARSFVVLKSLDIGAKPLCEEKFSDDCMDVSYIPILSEDSSDDYNSDSSGSSSQEFDDIDEPKPKKVRYSSQKKRCQDMVVAYACKGHSKPGQLLYEKCIDLGVPPGPLLGDLKNGKDVCLPTGKVVLSKDVVSEVQHCPVFLVVECPLPKFLKPFVSEEKFSQYQDASSPSSEAASLVVHFTPPNILTTPEYQDWMNKFPDSTCHLILNKTNATLNSAGVHRIQHKLNLLHPGIFSLLHENDTAEEFREYQKENIIQANTLDRYYLRPPRGLDRSFSIKMNSEEFIEEAMLIEGFQESLNHLKNNIQQHSLQQSNKDHFPIMSFLGTGSCIPSKARNVSAILVNTSENKYILLDCGEGTHDQLVRLHGKHHKKVLEHLNCIFISHMHADHHLGLIKILKTREDLYRNMKIQNKPLLLIGPKQLNFWLKNYHRQIEPITYLYRFLECTCLEHNQMVKLENTIKISKHIQISTVPVQHCPDAHGVIIAPKDSKWKIVYSGDTMPCEKLVEAGRDCSVLIHEATMEDDLLDEAVIKKHSTTSQAIKIGADMNSNYTVLTHFSQRYAKIPLFNENFHNHVGCAFDNMTVCSDELYILPLLIPALKCLFAEDVEDMNNRGDKRKKRIELINSMLNESVANKM
ncbi:ribonuclease Z, mitochondrial [Parasteatoda tepidariorum]|uniref:ribonuclease Z, mitochondrial n=1 Tax=Parasteatoda tepidariorum TaxID=114398 RepID=UPI00077F8DDE|nr:ribonuclease Z, mitochondrial [Parasteatoda tepidariorum]